MHISPSIRARRHRSTAFARDEVRTPGILGPPREDGGRGSGSRAPRAGPAHRDDVDTVAMSSVNIKNENGVRFIFCNTSRK